MKPRSLFLTLVVGLTAGLFACQDQGVVAPDADMVPPDGLDVTAKKGGGGNPGGGGTASLNLTGVLSGDALNGGVSWNYKKGEFRGNVSQGSIFPSLPPMTDAYLDGCVVSPEGAAVGNDLKEALRAGLTGKSLVLRVEIAEKDGESGIHRITSFVDGDVVRYFWIGPRNKFEDSFPNDASVSGFTEGDKGITYTLTGGIIGVRDFGSPSRDVQLACPNPGSVIVTLTK